MDNYLISQKHYRKYVNISVRKISGRKLDKTAITREEHRMATHFLKLCPVLSNSIDFYIRD